METQRRLLKKMHRFVYMDQVDTCTRALSTRVYARTRTQPNVISQVAHAHATAFTS